ncbi:hypothetical protein WR25_01450 [Diploscapter pachys]|uniref:G-protein coupled receptors family 1 profile domain-containing protein n=1 Tax=Diploscapter pachys TaxID=2018661 RepID=A0A2A2KJB4_9BILA|nr:hypothetical protein WR25_01450 [Diploscapter pachys]
MWMSQVDANGHYSLFITPLHYYQTYIGCAISVLTNGTLVYIILSRPHQKMGNYKYVVLAFVCFDILYSLVDVITKPGLYYYKQSFVLFSSGGLLSYPPPIGVFAACLWTAFFAIVKYMYLFTLKYAWIWVVVVALGSLDYALTCWFTMYPTETTYDFLEDTIQENFNISVRNLGFISSVYWISNNNTIQMSYRDFFGMINIFILECVTFSAMIYCGYKSQRALSKFNTMLSSSTRALQKSLLKALVIQTMVPLFLAYIPCWIGFSLPLTPFEVSKVTSNNVVITALTLFPICDCIVIIYYVKAFRDTLIEILGNIPCLNCWIGQILPDSRSTRSNKVHSSSQSNNKQCSTQMT